ncbi:Holliday junction resolvase RuvX [bacterium]|jgi:putative Holliday junction resolvase|nr:Holliday junction resolvase RuvX [bacterium]
MAVINNVMALDVGSVRIGVAVSSLGAKIPRPLTTLINSNNIFDEINNLVISQDVQVIVVGLPRGMDGQITEQTKQTQNFVKKLQSNVKLPIYTQDEALTSHKAKEELDSRGKPYAKEDIDALAATYILDDFILDNAKKLEQEL